MQPSLLPPTAPEQLPPSHSSHIPPSCLLSCGLVRLNKCMQPVLTFIAKSVNVADQEFEDLVQSNGEQCCLSEATKQCCPQQSWSTAGLHS